MTGFDKDIQGRSWQPCRHCPRRTEHGGDGSEGVCPCRRHRPFGDLVLSDPARWVPWVRDRAHDEARPPRVIPGPPPPPIWPRPDGRVRVGFAGPCYLSHGGTETWHRTLLPQLTGVQVVGYVVETLAVGAAPLPYPIGVGRPALRSLAATVDVLVAWGWQDGWGSLLPDPPPRVVFVSHGGADWTADSARRAAPHAHAWAAVAPIAATVLPEPDGAIIIPNAVDLPAPARTRAAVRAELGLSATAVCVFAPHRISSEKRVPMLAAAVERLGPPFVLVIAGDGADRVHLSESDQVRVLGGRHDVPDLYAAADLYVSASAAEGFGLSTAEAMAAGVPVLSTPVGFLIGHPELARYVPIDAGPQEWADAIRDEWDALSIRDLPPVFVLNLARRFDRWQSIHTQLDHLGIPHDRIEAVDGRLLDLPPLPPGLKPGNIGSSLSHRTAWQRLLDSGADRALILEDDAGLGPDFLVRLNRLLRAPGQSNLMKLGWYGAGFCNHAYLLTRAGATQLLAAVDPLAATCDDQIVQTCRADWHLCDPPFVIARPFESDITPFGPVPCAPPERPPGPRQRVQEARRFVAEHYGIDRHITAWESFLLSLAPAPALTPAPKPAPIPAQKHVSAPALPPLPPCIHRGPKVCGCGPKWLCAAKKTGVIREVCDQCEIQLV